jgi:hypothetical protein
MGEPNMAHEVIAKLHTKIVANKDLEIQVSTIAGGKLGTLLISKGNIEWLPKGNSVNKKSLSWVKFAELMDKEGKPTKGKK